ncbi:S-adenosyl-L-methionine-dependent methyltransferase [Rhodocollybia butyracea]|uniref:S-adenosyl-L-methionine-dependent methyltransferase n=1 Tax=Rhodocollybia butyracea TaxID=206335 RepID=A0A9P5UAR7_9AGAR|nr:S-adenosyl-L-methionine-dependent methyltransferase [Rhodocollybia butyracea]
MTTIPTPDLSHLSAQDYEHVYEPAEDTFLLLDALEADLDDLKAMNATLFLEVGSGSGCVSAFAAHILGSSTLYLSTDINARACNCTRRTGAQNKVTLDSIQTSFINGFHPRLKRSVDIICFNPPYVPTISVEASEAQGLRGIEGSWAGGSGGMQVTNVFLDMVHELLSPNGRFYLVAVKENNIPEIQERMKTLYQLDSKVVLSRRAGREYLSIVRFEFATST